MVETQHSCTFDSHFACVGQIVGMIAVETITFLTARILQLNCPYATNKSLSKCSSWNLSTYMYQQTTCCGEWEQCTSVNHKHELLSWMNMETLKE